MIRLVKRICRSNCMNNFRCLQDGDINFEELKNKVRDGAVLLDVRSPQEYAEGHLNGAFLLPDYEFNLRRRELEVYRNSTIVVYCRSGARSRKVYQMLKEMGYTNIYNLYGGLDNVLNSSFI